MDVIDNESASVGIILAVTIVDSVTETDDTDDDDIVNIDDNEERDVRVA